MSDTYMIDPPVGPYSAPEEIEAWIAKLRTYPITPEVEQAISDAETMLDRARQTRDAK
jgi:hypothetical protein